jgi:hypothetical protein
VHSTVISRFAMGPANQRFRTDAIRTRSKKTPKIRMEKIPRKAEPSIHQPSFDVCPIIPVQILFRFVRAVSKAQPITIGSHPSECCTIHDFQQRNEPG